MLNKFLKNLFLFNIVLILANVFSVVALAYTKDMIIDTTSLNTPKGDDYPILLGTFESMEDLNMVGIEGPGGGNAIYPTSASVDVLVAEHNESGKFYGDAKIFRLNDSSGSSNYGFTIKIIPLYKGLLPGQPPTANYGDYSFPGDYIKKGNTNNSWKYASNQSSDEKFRAINLGAKITIQIFALQKTISDISTIGSQKLAELKFRADRSSSSAGPYTGSAFIRINSFIINPSSNTCKITPSDAHVINMKPVSIKDFPSIGSEVDGGGETTITLTCSKEATSVKVGMTDITERNNTSNQLKLDPKSTSLGFAVTLYRDNGNIISYNPDPKTGNNTWELSPSTSSGNSVNYKVPIKAKYYRTGSIISPGTILANAAITFIYE